MYGRSGQKQNGIDIFVIDRGTRIGVQCKHVAYGSKLNISRVRKDIVAAQKLPKPISKFVLYTSASNDVRTIDQLDQLKPFAEALGIEFSYLMWREFEDEIREYDLLLRLLGLAELPPASQSVDETDLFMGRPFTEPSKGLQSAGTVQSDAGVPYSAMLDSVTALIRNGNVAGASILVDVILNNPETVSAAQLAKAYSTKAILEGRAGHIADSAKYWRQAADVEPNPDLKYGRHAQALLCEDRYPEALETALKGLTAETRSSLSALAAVIASQHVGRRAEIDARLSEALKSERDIGLVRAHVALADNELELALEIVAAVDVAHPDDADVISLRADLLVRQALGDEHKIRSELIMGRARNALEAALPLYRQSLSQRDPILERAGWLPSALNFIAALKLLNRNEEAADVAANVIDKLGHEIQEIERLILALAEGGRPERALAVSEMVSNPSVRVLHARASALLHLQCFGEAEALLETIEATDELDADNQGWMLLVARMQVKPTADLAAFVDDYYSSAKRKLSACSRIVENATVLGYSVLAAEYGRKAIELFEIDSDPEYLLFVVDSMLMLGDEHSALRLLLPQVNLDYPEGGPLEERLAYCLFRQHRFESLGKLLSGLPVEANQSGHFDQYRVNYHLALGDKPGALIALETARGHQPKNMLLAAMEVKLLRELGRTQQAKERFNSIYFDLLADLASVALYVREARLLGESEAADSAAYRWIRDRGNVPENAAWFIQDFLLQRSDKSSPVSLPLVTRRCGVGLREVRGDQRRWIVIDDRFPDAIANGWFSPNSPHVSKIIGQPRLGAVEVDAFAGGPFIIEDVSDEYIGAFRIISSRYGNQMPMVQGVRVISLPRQENDGSLNFDSLFNALDDGRESEGLLRDLYASNFISIGMLAYAAKCEPIALWSTLVGTGSGVRAMSGDAKSAAAFAKRLEGEAPHIVLDPVTLFSWSRFGLLDTALRSVRSISMTESGVAVIRNRSNGIGPADGCSRTGPRAHEQPGLYERSDIAQPIMEFEHDHISSLISWIESNIKVLPTPAAGILEETYSAMRANGPAYLADMLQLAAHKHAVLVVDDMALEQACNACNVIQVATIPLLRSAFEARRIARTELSRALLELTAVNYEFTSFNAENLWDVTDLNSLAISPSVSSMLRYLRISSVDLHSAVLVVFAYLQMLAEEQVPNNILSASVTVALSALTQHGRRETSPIFGAFSRFCTEKLHSRYRMAVQQALITWLAGHFLTPADVGTG